MIGILFFCHLFSAFSSPFTQSITKQEFVHYGKLAYEKRCVSCHGVKGDGQGPGAVFLEPKPRDFTKGIFKFRSSPIGTLPSDQDLMRVISYGVAGTSMPEFSFIPEKERFALVEYIKTFSPDWQDPTKYGQPVVGSPFPKEDFIKFNPFIARAKKGRQIFIEACVLCHGVEGRGDGESAADLTDDWGQPIKPQNLRNKTIKKGPSVQDLYQTILVGVNGTPMPAFKDTYSDDDLWNVAAYVLYMRGEEAKMYSAPHIPTITLEELK